MQIETKYNVNDEVWAIHPAAKKAISGKVSGINGLQTSKREVKEIEGTTEMMATGNLILGDMNIHYQIDFGPDYQAAMMMEGEVFASKEELIKEIAG